MDNLKETKKRINDNNLSLKSFFSQKKMVITFISFCMGQVFSITFLSEKNIGKNILTVLGHSVSIGAILCVLLLVAFVFVIVLGYITQMKREVEKRYSEVNDKEAEFEKRILELNSSINAESGDAMFNLAMGLDTYEPVKFNLLEKAINKYHHVLSAVYLGNLYHSGLSRGDKVIIEKNNFKAFEIYKSVINYDVTGLIAWKIGWMHELGQAPGASENKTENQKVALDFYRQSAKLGYPKAFNSIGKFYAKSYAGLNKDRFAAINNYKKAEEGGDIYATLNEAYIHCELQEEFPLAVECFERAIKTGSPLAYLKFAKFIEDNHEYFKNKYTLWDMLSLYCQAANSNNGSDAARAYYHIGCLFKMRYNEFFDYEMKVSQKISLQSTGNFSRDCFLKAFEILDSLMKRGIKVNDTSKELYKEILNELKEEYQ